LEVCKRQGINPDELTIKTADDFVEKHSGNSFSAQTRHQIELMESEANLASVRAKHHESRRQSK